MTTRSRSSSRCSRAYERLWSELTHEEVFARRRALPPRGAAAPAERARLRRRRDRAAADATRATGCGCGRRCVEPGHHRRRLLQLTGLRAQENQARRLLDDLDGFRRRAGGARASRPISAAALAGRWLNDVFEPSIAAIPAELWGKREAAELYHELLEHRWYQSQRKGATSAGTRRCGRTSTFCARSPTSGVRCSGDERPV